MLKVIVASPTLSQGLNLNAAVLLVPYLVRAGQEITGEEFANVAGRAGRAFVDVEGLVAHVIYENADYRLQRWRNLVNSARARDLQSGLFQVITEVLNRLAGTGLLARADAFEYLANSRDGWALQDAAADVDSDEDSAMALIEKLDAMIFGLIEALDADSDDLPRLLDEALNGSLWARKVARVSEEQAELHRALLRSRAQLIWTHTTPAQRRGHFAMGVGLDSGLALDEIADELAGLVDLADAAAIAGDADALAEALIAVTERLLTIRPFAPASGLPDGWPSVLRSWVSGAGVDQIGPDRMKLVEEAFGYRLVWGLEAIRTRRVTAGWTSDLIAGGGAAAAETGVPSLMMAMLIRAGLPSRRAAIAAVETGGALFASSAEMRAWIISDEVAALSAQEDWPTAETAALWHRFRDEVVGTSVPVWKVQTHRRRLALTAGQVRPADGLYRVEIDRRRREAWIVSPDFQRVARVRKPVRDRHSGLYSARFVPGDDRAHIERLGPGEALWGDAAL